MLEMFLMLTVGVILVVASIFLIRRGIDGTNAKRRVMSQVAMFAGVFVVMLVLSVSDVAAAEDAMTGSLAQGLGFLSAAVATGCSSLGAGLAVAAAAPAAIGAISENSDNFGKAMIFVALGEGVAIYGLLIAILIINAL